MNYSQHAQERIQQRRISETEINIILTYGEWKYRHNGAKVYQFTKGARLRFEESRYKTGMSRKECQEYVKRCRKSYIVVSAKGEIITAAYLTKRQKFGRRKQQNGRIGAPHHTLKVQLA